MLEILSTVSIVFWFFHVLFVFFYYNFFFVCVQMTANASTYEYLVQSGSMGLVGGILKDIDDPWASLCRPFALRFYGHLANVKVRIYYFDLSGEKKC